MKFKCTTCGDPSDKGYSWVETTWCPISLEILHRTMDILCRPCYLVVKPTAMNGYVVKPTTMMDYAEQALRGVKKVEKAEEKVIAAAVEISEE